MTQPVIEIQQLTRRFGKTTALDDVSLSVPAGGVFGLVGENGAGKSTLMNVLIGAVRPDAGELPSAYKRAGEVVRQIRAFDLAEIVDYVDPYGCIMAGDWKSDFHRRRIEAKRARRREKRATR